MRENAPALAPPEVELNTQLLDAKLSPPRHEPRGAVSRTTLIGSARSSGRRVVSITAPAGYGKSTLLTQWADTEERPVAWVSLDRFDDDPIALLTLLATAFAQIAPSASRLGSDVRRLGGSPLGRAAPAVAAALKTSRTPFVIILDDLHELRNPDCHDALSVVIAGVPPGSQFVAASRGEQPHLAQARAQDDSMEITPVDLALDEAGARRVFAGAELPLSPEDAAQVIQRTEGWPVGVFLAAAITRDGGEMAVSGDDRYVADYLYREALVKLPEHHQQFLRRTAVLDRMSGPLCDAVLGTDDAQSVLRELEASDAFLIALDRRRGWFRYHELFREFLLGELRRVEPKLILGLHRRAAGWFEQNGSPAMAIEHLLDLPSERLRVTHLVSEATLATYQAGLLTTVQRWLRELGDKEVEGYPPLAVIAGWIALLTGRAAEADRWAEILERLSYDGVPDNGSASFESGRAMLRSFMCAQGPARALEDAKFAVAAEAIASPWRDQALYLLGEAQLLAGDSAAAEVAFDQGSTEAELQANSDIRIECETHLGMLLMDDGRWVEAAEHIGAALEVIEQRTMQDYAISVPAFAQAARLALHRGDLEDVHRQLTRAMRARPASTFAMPYLAVRGRLELAKVFWALSNQTTAHHLVREIEDILVHRPALGALIDQVADFRTMMSSSRQSGRSGGPPLTTAELRLLPYLQTHLTMREIGDRLYLSRNTVSTEVGAVYRKLGVSTRSEAVQQATEMGLLGA
ncbi:AAA family ATPase [Microbacterium sp. B35-30]|uniref:AAA family ATPase n=1 Tax=Microbacterium sp. B35-30 TaxID=1962642 RepID=UPI0013D89143|nr:AAA family ATPase [Microbacterium sp. B35-30]KAF2415744.1 LuxR family transcriptional regulator [Microbacterium sp. B35-30]